MYNKLTFFLSVLIVLISNFNLSAQELSEKPVNVTYYAYPSSTLSAKSYSVNLQGTLAADPYYKGLINREAKLNGLTKVDAPGKGEIVLTIETPNIKIDSVGTITGSGDEHYFNVKYTLPVTVSLTAESGVLFSEQYYPNPIIVKSEYSGDPTSLQLLYSYGNSMRDHCLRNTVPLAFKRAEYKVWLPSDQRTFSAFLSKREKA